MAKTISQQIDDLQEENKRLKSLEKCFEKMAEIYFSISAKKITKILENHSENKMIFLTKIADFYDLKTDQDFTEFLDIFCTEEFETYYLSKHKSDLEN